jgi:uncharacterized membrane protein
MQRELKKMEELITHYTRQPQQAELSRLKLDKILKECFVRLQDSAISLHDFIETC